MKKILLVAFLMLSFMGSARADGITRAVMNPDIDAKPGLFWYWMNGNISKEGIIEDLRAMDEIGVGWVYIFDIGLHPSGKVLNRSEEWYDMVRTAIQEAKKYGIKIHLTSPGWAVYGGKWVTPELSQKEMVWSEQFVHGGQKIKMQLEQPAVSKGFYKDIAVLAFPARRGDEILGIQPAIVNSDGQQLDSAAAYDNNYETTVEVSSQIELVFDKAENISSVYFRMARPTGYYNAEVSWWDAAKGEYVSLGTVRPNNAGPFTAQIGELSFAQVKTEKIAVKFTSAHPIVEELRVYGGMRMPDWIRKAGFGTIDLTTKANDPYQCAPVLPEDVIALGDIKDLTAFMSEDGILEWNAPAGDWTIQRFGYTSNGISIFPAPAGGAGLECDKMSKEAVRHTYQHAIKNTLDELGEELSKAVSFHHVDSYESGWQNWTAGFENEFRSFRGYDIMQCLPAMTGRVVENVDLTEKFYWDLRSTINHLYVENFYGELAQYGRKDGLEFSNEPYGGPFNYLDVGGRIDVPMVEFWVPSTQPRDRKINFEGVFAGRTNGRKVIASETFTSEAPSERWSYHPYTLKAIGDYVYCSGVNRFIMHVSAHQPFTDPHMAPGLTCGINGIHYDRFNTWWYDGGKAWNEYLTRCQALLQYGLHVADVLYFQGSEAPAAPRWYEPELPIGYDLDACGESVLLQLTMKNGRLTLPDGKSYRYLVLPSHGWMTTASILKVQELVEAGATVIGKPVPSTPSLSDVVKYGDEREKAYQNLWNDGVLPVGMKKVGQGRVFWGLNFDQLLAEDGLIEDFSYDKNANLLLNYIHRTSEEGEIYFVANGNYRQGTVNCRFRVGKDMTPVLMDPATGKEIPVRVYKATDTYTDLPITFDPAGSTFVIFRKAKAETAAIVSVRRNGKNIFASSTANLTTNRIDNGGNSRNISDDFTVSFWCKPEATIALPKQTVSGIWWSEQNWAIFPSPGHERHGVGNSGMGVSAGRNGVVVFEHWEGNVAPVVSYRFDKNHVDWYHVTVVYKHGQPTLYINGELAQEGLASPRHAHPSTGDANDQNKSYLGELKHFSELTRALSAEEVRQQHENKLQPEKGEGKTVCPVAFTDHGMEISQTGTYKVKMERGSRKVVVKELPVSVDLSKNWYVSFPEGWGAPASIELPVLKSLSEHELDGVKYFSGTSTYTHCFTLEESQLPDGHSIYLDLGEVSIVAQVKLNGKDLGILWKAPFRCDVTDILHPGENNLEIQVSNLWGNRMIGDQQYPEMAPYSKFNGMIDAWPEWVTEQQERPVKERYTFTALSAWQKDDALPVSGIVGPVRLVYTKQVNL